MVKVLMFPGASLMDITPLDDGGLRVRCPGCDHVHEYHDDLRGDFLHADGCPVHARIEKAARQYVRERRISH